MWNKTAEMYNLFILFANSSEYVECFEGKVESFRPNVELFTDNVEQRI